MWYRAVGCIVTYTLSLLAVPLVTTAQPRGNIPRVGVLTPGAPPNVADPRTCDNGFQQGLHGLGYVDGHNIRLAYRYGEGQPQRLPALVTELVQLAPAVIWTHSTDAIRAVQQATTTIPIVVGVGINLVEEGLVTALARPGGNLTGLELRDIELAGKRLALFKDAFPALSRVAVLVNPTEGGQERIPGDMAPEAQVLGVQLQRVEAGSPDTFEAAFAAMVRGGAEAVIIMDGNMFARHRHRLLELALLHRLPTMSGGRHFAEAGSLLAYGAFPRELCQRSAVFVDKLLKGATPADLPVERADKFYLVVNLKTAAALGVTLPPQLLFQADAVLK
jgi:putative ABC transport system substrate-binding protein